MTKRLRTLLVLCGILLLLLACHAAAPVLYAAEDTALLTGYLARRRLDGRLSSDAMDIFLVRRLHERAGDPGYTGYERVVDEQQDIDTAMRQALEQCQSLLGEDNHTRLLKAMDGETATYTAAMDSYGFWQNLCDFGDGQGMMGIEYDSLTGAVVRLWVQARMYQTGRSIFGTLQSYNSMLGMEGLEDWQTGWGYYDATLTSEGAGLMLYLYDKDGVFQLGVEVITARA